jgi:hypothetical protein
MASEVEWAGVEAYTDAVGRVQEALSDGVLAADETTAEYLEELQKRLLRVQSWGGAYAAVDLSPEAKALLMRSKVRGKVLVS